MIKGKIRKNIDFLAVNTLPNNTVSYWFGCDDLASNMAAVDARALRLVAAASKRSKEWAFCSLPILWYWLLNIFFRLPVKRGEVVSVSFSDRLRQGLTRSASLNEQCAGWAQANNALWCKRGGYVEGQGPWLLISNCTCKYGTGK